MAYRRLAVLTIATGLAANAALAQRGPAPANARDVAPIDLTGTWVSVVSEDWRHRMATPRRGDYESVPLNAAGRRAADGWDLAADNAAGVQCKAFGIGGIMRQPGRLNISWEDDETLRIDFDAGTQTRLLHFDNRFPESNERTWQGHSMAVWQRPPGGRGGAAAAGAPRGGAGAVGSAEGVAAGGGGRGQRGGPPPSASIYEGGSLEVRTTMFREGYLRKNGVPYSEDAMITEYFNRLPTQPNGDEWLLVTTVVDDPTYLSQPFYTSTHFRLEPDDDGFNPTPCRTAPPPP
ncbi:MAG: hypothetical protein PVH89_07105 [Gammaproteobacteria bacterium]|jgi:hypothetical protein